MVLHQFDQPAAAAQVPRSGHTAREHHHILFSSPIGLFEIVQLTVDPDHQAVGGNHEGILRNADELHVNTRPFQDIAGAEGFDVLEAVRQKNVNSFHTLLSAPA